MGRENTDRSRKSPTTSVTVGRRAGSRCQQLSVILHTEPVRPSSRASRERAGRSPLVIFKMMIGSVQPLNGYLPVKTFTGIQTSGELTIPPPDARRGETRKPTSIATIPKEKMSASGVTLSPLSRTSGAAQASVYPFTFVTRTEFSPRTTDASPKSVKRALPLWSTRMLG